MPFNGNGVFNRLYNWVNDAANNINILATRMDNETNGIAAGLTNCVTRDGQSPPTADIPWGNFRLTGLATPTADDDAATKGYVDDVTQAATTLRTYLTRAEMSAVAGAALGSTTYLSESLRAGTFQVVSAAFYTAAIAADPYQAYFVPVTADASLVWMRQFIGPALFDWGGADRTGVTDTGAQINAMIRNPFCKTFLGGEGIYSSTQSLGFTGGTYPVSIVGLGPEATLFSFTGNINGFQFEYTNPEYSTQLENFTVQNTGTPVSGAAIRLSKSYYTKINNVFSIDFFYHFDAVQCALGSYKQFNCNGVVDTGIRYTGGNSFNEDWADCTLGGQGTALRGFDFQDGFDRPTLSNVVFSSFISAGRTDATLYGTGTRPQFLTYNNCDWDSCQNGPDFDHCYVVRLFQNFMSCRPGYAFTFGRNKTAEKLVTDFNTIYFNGTYGAIIGPYAVDWILGANDVYASNGSGTPNTYSDILVETGIAQSSGQILGGAFRDDPGISSSVAYRIHIKTGVADGYHIGACIGTAGATGFLLDETLGAARFIANQPLYRTVSEGAATTSGAGTVSYPHLLAEQPPTSGIQITPQQAITNVNQIATVTGFPDATHVTITGGASRGYSVRCAIAGN